MTAPINVNEAYFAQKARTAWGQLPEWVARLAAEADRVGQRATAERIGYTDGVVSAVIANKYRGDVAKVEGKVRGAFMGETVLCPILGEIGRDRCLKEQGMPRAATSALRSQLWHACRSGQCPHSKLVPFVGDADAAA